MKFKKFLSIALSSLMVFQASFVCKAGNEGLKKVAKVVFFGPAKSGKTQISNKLKGYTFCSDYLKGYTFWSDYVATIGTRFLEITPQDKNLDCNLKLNCWDTGGQKKYGVIVRYFHQNANIGVLVLDASTDINTQLRDVKNLLENFKQNAASGYKLLLVFNKMDIVGKENTRAQIDKYAAQFERDGISADDVFLTSAKTGEGIAGLEKRLFDITKGLQLTPNLNDTTDLLAGFNDSLLEIRNDSLPFWKDGKGQLAIGGAGSGLALLIGSGVYAYNKFKNRNQKIEKNNAVNRTKNAPAKTQKLVLKQ